MTFDLVPIFGRDFLEPVLRLKDDLDVADVDVACNHISFNPLSMPGILVMLQLQPHQAYTNPVSNFQDKPL